MTRIEAAFLRKESTVSGVRSASAEHAHLRRDAETAEAVAALHAAHAAVIARERETILRSTSWRISAPVRIARYVGGWAVSVVPGAVERLRSAARLARRGRVRAAVAMVAQATAAHLRHMLRRVAQARTQAARAADLRRAYAQPGTRAAAGILAPRVLIIAETIIPQCTKYRVLQRREQLERLGYAATIVHWRDAETCYSLLQVHVLAVFYRVPGDAAGMALIAEARRLGVACWWEVDDLIFDAVQYRQNRNLLALDWWHRRILLRGAAQYRAAMLACDRTIASTEALAASMRAAGAAEPIVIENALDRQTLAIAGAIRARRRPRTDGAVVIAYGSGTRTHDADFLCAAPALARLLRVRPQVRLSIIGVLTIPACLDDVADRIDRVGLLDFPAYMERLGAADISIAPLEDTQFNAAKSNIKLLEASILGLPSVCSTAANFRAAIEAGEDGFLASDEEGWFEALRALVDDRVLRERVGEAARRRAQARYAPDRVALTQTASLVEGLDSRAPNRLRVLVVNIYFPPQSFGGATIVAEAVARRLHARADAEIVVFTSCVLDDVTLYSLHRYDSDGVPVIAIRLPITAHTVLDFDNPEVTRAFADVLQAVQPDVVHVHCVQGLGASILRPCQDRQIPYVVTLHDAWWLCARQFMVRGDNNYCWQTRIDIAECLVCTHFADHVTPRTQRLVQALHGAALLLSPSESHRQLYLANGFAEERVLVNRNGVRMPLRPRQRPPGPDMRFGYTGGNVVVKGAHLVRQAFEALDDPQARLVLVDNTRNLGFSSFDISDWKCSASIDIVPAYAQADMDLFFESIDVLLFPSQWKESFGLTVREAMLRDVWVIVTDCGGAAEDVIDGVNGSIIPMNHDPACLLNAMRALLARPDRLAGYVNPHKAVITGYDQQAADVFEHLRTAAITTEQAAAEPITTAPIPTEMGLSRTEPVRWQEAEPTTHSVAAHR